MYSNCCPVHSFAIDIPPSLFCYFAKDEMKEFFRRLAESYLIP